MPHNERFNPYLFAMNTGYKQAPEYLNLQSHLKLIMVHEPYLALHSYYYYDDCLFARFPMQAHIENECYPVTTAEVGRHMAILGSLALAVKNPVKEPHYYLALHAVVTRKSFAESFEKELIGKITSCTVGRKTGRITGEVINQNCETIFEVEVDYSLMHYQTFDRFFKVNYRETVDVFNENPFLNEVKISNIKLGMEHCYAEIGKVTPLDCSGHFHHYPALPVARLGGALTKISGIHYNLLSNDLPRKYAFKCSEITAYFLPFAGEEVYLESYIDKHDDVSGQIVIRALAFTKQSKLVAELISEVITINN